MTTERVGELLKINHDRYNGKSEDEMKHLLKLDYEKYNKRNEEHPKTENEINDLVVLKEWKSDIDNLIKTKDNEAFVKVINEKKCINPEIFTILITDLERQQYEKITELIDTNNNKIFLVKKESFENPEIVERWCAYIGMLFDYAEDKVIQFVRQWFLAKQNYMREQYIFCGAMYPDSMIEHLKYCYKLHHCLMKLYINKKITEKNDAYYEQLSIQNQNTIQLLHRGGHFLRITDNLDQTATILIEFNVLKLALL